MKEVWDSSEHAAELYRKAEDKIASEPAAAEVLLREWDAKRLVHELQVHQIELEMQNSELRRSTLEQELLLEEYTSLYDFAPVGYMSLDRDGHILKSNLAGAVLVGLTRSLVDRLPFWQFVARDDRPRFADFLQKAFNELSGKTTCELRLLKKGRETIFAQLEVQASGSSLECLVAIIDVTCLRHEEQKFHIVADRLAQSFEELELLASELNLSEERERRRIALALHDQVVQSLAIGKMNLDAALRKGDIIDHPVLQDLQRTLVSAMLDLRDLSRDLSPPILYDLGLGAAIANLGDELGGKYAFRFVLQADDAPVATLSEELTVSVFQFCRELLMNIVKHARATLVTVTLQQKGDWLMLSVGDDGVGFDLTNYSEGFGLANIKRRINYLRGDFRIESSAGKGTNCHIMLDIRCSEKRGKEKPDGNKSTACR
jgi:PAS domain S-box-containing protein